MPEPRADEEAVYRRMAQEMAANGTLATLQELLRDLALLSDQRIREKIRRGTVLEPDDWPQLQLDQGRIQALQELSTKLDRLAKEREPTHIRQQA